MVSGIHVLDAAAVVIVGTAVLSYLNHRFIRLPVTIGIAFAASLLSVTLLAIDSVLPQAGLGAFVRGFLAEIDFRTTLLDGMLSFLLFAGALHVDLEHLYLGKWPISLLATLGVVISTAVVGFGLRILAGLVGIDIPIGWCLVFGALISPTDPVATMALLQPSAAPESLKATVAGESLFNDGVGVVVFTILLAAVAGGETLSFWRGGEMFVVEAGGGALLGLAIGWIGFLAMKSIDDRTTELLISIAMVMGGYALARVLGVSGPVAMAVAGILIGNQGVALAMSESTRDHLLKFWELVDEVLNAALFLLIGLEGVILLGAVNFLALGALAVGLVLVARILSVAGPLAIWKRMLPVRTAFPILVWGGLRGGISIALALSLPPSPNRDAIVAATYVVVIFSVLVQGSTVGPMIARLVGSGGTRKLRTADQTA
jgi:CPA1 family monovalent cation:H+ antiporter